MKYLRKILIILVITLFIPVNVLAEEFPNIISNNVIYIDLDNNNVIYEKDSSNKVLIASLTKIMTTITAIEKIDNYDEKIVITNDMISGIGYDYAKVGFKVGDVVTYNDVLYGILLESGADATNIIAVSTYGSIDKFVDKMNENAKRIGMKNTSFTNTIGIDNENHYSTAKDLSILLKYALENDKFKEIFTSETYTSSDSKHEMKGPVKAAHSDSVNMDYLLGAKTGYTKAAGHCFASVSKNKNKEYLLITLGNYIDNKSSYFSDSKSIYEYYFNNYDYKKILSKDDTILKLKTQYDEKIEIKSKEKVIRYIDKNITNDELTYEFDGKKILKKGIKKNDFIGNFYIKNKDEVLYKTKIYSPKTVRITFDYFINHNKVELIILFILIILLIISMNKLLKNRKNKHR